MPFLAVVVLDIDARIPLPWRLEHRMGGTRLSWLPEVVLTHRVEVVIGDVLLLPSHRLDERVDGRHLSYGTARGTMIVIYPCASGPLSGYDPVA